MEKGTETTSIFLASLSLSFPSQGTLKRAAMTAGGRVARARPSRSFASALLMSTPGWQPHAD